jgi:hypothetical protein
MRTLAMQQGAYDEYKTNIKQMKAILPMIVKILK